MREMVKESVDLELRARALELEALDKAVRELRQELLAEVNDRQRRAESLWKSLIENPNPGSGSDADPFGGLSDDDLPGRMPGRRAPAKVDGPAEGAAG